MATSRFDGPIPGQSLTTTPKNARWEKPPQFTKKDDALEYLLNKLLSPVFAARMITMLDNNTPVEALVRVIIFGGFMQGTWAMDLGVLIAQPLGAMIATIYYMLRGRKPPLTTFNQGQPDQGLLQDMQNAKQQQAAAVDVSTPQKEAITNQLKRSGILGPR